MYNKVLIAIFMVVLVALAIYIPTRALTGYAYSQKITVTNTSGADVTSRVEITTNPAALIAGTFIQADADDVAITNGGVQGGMMAFDLGNNGVDWVTQVMTVPANSSDILYLWYGDADATRDQNWIGTAGDTQVVTDDASLDITNLLTLQADVYLDDVPVSEQEIISKDDAYRLTVDATNFNMGIYSTTVGSQNSSTGSYDVSAGATYTEAGEQFDFSAIWPNIDQITVSTIDIYLGKTLAPVGTAYCRIRDVATRSLQGTLGSVDVTTLGAGAFVTFNSTPVTFDAEPFSITIEYTGGDAANYVDVFYDNTNPYAFGVTCHNAGGWGTSAGDDMRWQTLSLTLYAEISTPLTTDTWITLTGSYTSGGNLSIDDGGTPVTEAMTGNIDTNGNDVEIGEFDVWLDDVRIGDTNIATPTWRLNLQYEPDQMAAAVITDQSASTNDAAYTLAGMSGSFTVGIDAMLPAEEETLPSVPQNDSVSPAGYDLVQPSDWSGNDGTANVGTDTIPGQIMQPLIDTSGLDAKWIWWFAFGILNILAFVGSMKVLGLHVAVGWISALVVCALFVMWGPIPWWFLAFYGIGIIGVFTIERSPQV